jgi:hypothetical protein
MEAILLERTQNGSQWNLNGERSNEGSATSVPPICSFSHKLQYTTNRHNKFPIHFLNHLGTKTRRGEEQSGSQIA